MMLVSNTDIQRLIEALAVRDLLTSHTARRSFATNAYASRVPVESIMAVTGHSSELRLRDYVRNAPEASASIVATDFEKFLEL